MMGSAEIYSLKMLQERQDSVLNVRLKTKLEDPVFEKQDTLNECVSL